jgi:phosphoribosyl 1,2-cyclic phosphodiesterase
VPPRCFRKALLDDRPRMDATLRILASGSSGNSLFLRIGETRLLVDAGIPARAIDAALREMGEAISDLDAVLLTHEHSDHCRGLPGLVKRVPDLSLRATRGTARGLARDFEVSVEAPYLRAGEAIHIDLLRILPIPVLHDASEPTGYRIQVGDFAVGIVTDIGASTPAVVDALSGCNVLIVEANHDLELLRRGPYPGFLKRRVASRKGHLSNEQAHALIRSAASARLQHVILTHLSGTNNDPALALRDIEPALEHFSQAQLRVGAPKKPGEILRFDVGVSRDLDASEDKAEQLSMF